MKKSIAIFYALFSLPVLSYTGTIKFETKGISINGNKPEKQVCVFKFENTPKPLAQCLVKYSKDGAIECPLAFRLQTIVNTCLNITKTTEDDLNGIEYEIYDEKGKLLSE